MDGSRALVTGGLGFIGSNLAIALVERGVDVCVVDARIDGYGANDFNLAPVAERVEIVQADVRDRAAMDELVAGRDFVFHLAGQVDHVLSLTDPFPDIDINITGTAVLMEACRRNCPRARVLYTGTRGQYGPAVSLPVTEEAATHPKGLHEISNLTAEKIVKMYHDVHGIHSVLLRLTNTYGPRGQMRHSRYGVVNWFVRRALDGDAIAVFGDGAILRDYLYVDDCVEAILACMECDAAAGQPLNVGTQQPVSFRELAETIVSAAGSGRWELAPFSPERKAQEPGDFYCDIGRIRKLVGWQPRTGLADGLRATAEYYRAHKDRYW